MSAYRIGVDLDNTIVCYDELLYREARVRQLIPEHLRSCKRDIRDWIRRAPDGECQWQKLQALAYGAKMDDATLVSGVEPFFRTCRDQGIPVAIMSHKTPYATFDETRTNLRKVALRWLSAKRFFDPEGLALRPEQVYFALTRQEKIAQIAGWECTHFIDDLEETFLEPGFPLGVEKLLYRPDGSASGLAGVITMGSWQQIDEHFFSHVRR